MTVLLYSAAMNDLTELGKHLNLQEAMERTESSRGRFYQNRDKLLGMGTEIIDGQWEIPFEALVKLGWLTPDGQPSALPRKGGKPKKYEKPASSETNQRVPERDHEFATLLANLDLERVKNESLQQQILLLQQLIDAKDDVIRALKKE